MVKVSDCILFHPIPRQSGTQSNTSNLNQVFNSLQFDSIQGRIQVGSPDEVKSIIALSKTLPKVPERNLIRTNPSHSEICF